MGLDQYGYFYTGVKVPNKYFDTSKPVSKSNPKEVDEQVELAYWRKHPNLQGFMHDLWERKGRPNPKGKELGVNPMGDFNCIPLELTAEDLDELEDAVNGKELPETSGFFFGDDSDEYYKEEDLKFIKNARKAIADGKQVFYDCWW